MSGWTQGNSARLLENGEEFFPAVFEAIRAARREVIVETFILADDKVGRGLQQALAQAAARGVSVDLLVDGYGSAELDDAFVQAMTSAGVRVRTFDATARRFGLPARWTRRLKVLRRMHRKLAVIDGQRAFVGGINYSADHLMDHGAMAKQDYAVELAGPVVADIHRFACSAIGRHTAAQGTGAVRPGSGLADPTGRLALPVDAPGRAPVGAMYARFVTRDNLEHHNDIERQYRLALRTARERVTIANAYFFPGYRVLRQLVRAARRGVDVRLVLQGEPDLPIVRWGATLLYAHLLRHGVKIHEYRTRPLHGKVAVIDGQWATVGSSNLDPLSLSLNLEANAILHDAAFARELDGRLDALIATECRAIGPLPPPRWSWYEALRTMVVFHVLRRFPVWASLLPRHAPTLARSYTPTRAPTAPERQARSHTPAAHPPARPAGRMAGHPR